MYWTRFLIPTSKETPADAAAPSHRLMLRAGMIRQVAAGAYSYLPFGWRVLQRVTGIVRQEMNRAGAIELNMPAMQPLEWWAQTGRDAAMGDTLIRLPDQAWRRGTVLGPTHEEVITEIARAYLTTYKHLPKTLYQIQTKFRDEQRPKSGVLRTREFLMKDAYSFDADKAGLDASYDAMYRAYCRICERCRLPYVVVEAESGPIGGDASHEFMVATEAGEDYMVRSEDGTYRANLERAAVAPLSDTGGDAVEDLTEVHTPGLKTVDEVARFLHRPPGDFIKTLIYWDVSVSDERQRPWWLACVRGDHEINEAKLSKSCGGRLELIPEAAGRNRALPVGFIGPHLDLRAARIAGLVIDQAVAVMHNAVSGANRVDHHVTGINPGRDFPTEGDDVRIADVRYAVPGDRAPNGSPLIFDKCIEVGHVFKLGTRYSEAMHAFFVNQAGQQQPMIMGCYGIGINRIIAAAIESYHDESGVCWPMSVAPFHVLICALDMGVDEVRDTAVDLHDELEANGIEALLDDRDARPGVKFKDADLIGIPLRLTVGRRGLKEGVVELKRRDKADVSKLAVGDVVRTIVEAVSADLTPVRGPR